MGCTQGGKAVSSPGGNSRSDAQRSQYNGARKDASAWRTSWRQAAARKAAIDQGESAPPRRAPRRPAPAGLGRAGIGQPQAPAIAHQGVPPRRDPLLLRQGIAGPPRGGQAPQRDHVAPTAAAARRTPAPAPARVARADRAPTGTPDSRRRNSPPPHPAAQRPARATTACRRTLSVMVKSGNEAGNSASGALLPKHEPNALGASTQVWRVSSAAPGPSHPDAHPASGWTSPLTGASACWLPEMPCSSSTTARACAGSGP